MLDTTHPGVPIADMAPGRYRCRMSARHGTVSVPFANPPAGALGFMGHGMSCWAHGLPTIHPDSIDILETNTVLVVEVILGQAGVRRAKIWDSVLVTPRGAERLSELDIRVWP